MPNKIKVAIVAGDLEERKGIYDTLSYVTDISIVGETGSMDAGINMIGELKNDVTIVGSTVEGSDSFKFSEAVVVKYPFHPIIMFTALTGEEIFRKAMRCGIKELLQLPADTISLSDSIYRAFDLKEKHMSSINQTYLSDPSERDNTCKIISVFSTKGGVGKTTIASNMAVFLKQNSKKVALLDLDVYSGDVALAMDIVPKGSISDLVNDINRLDIDLLESYMVRHSSGVMILAAPMKIEYADFVSAEHVKKILKVLAQEYDYVVVDCASYMHDPVLVALEASEMIFLVTTLDIFAIKNLKACIASLEALNFSRSIFRLIINRTFRGAGITETDIQTTLGLPVTAVLPQDDQVLIKSINQGTPAVISYKNSGFVRGIQDLGKKITEKRTASGRDIKLPKKMSS